MGPIVAINPPTFHLKQNVNKWGIGLSGGTRTPDLLLRRQLLYPVELRTASLLVYRARQRDKSKALLTTLTELKAMAAPATIGFKPPSAASGIPSTL